MSESNEGVVGLIVNMELGRAAMLGLIIANTIGIGSLVIFICWNDLFLELDISKLLLLAVAMTAPFLSFGAFAYHVGEIKRDYEAVDKGLRGSMIYSMAAYLLFILGMLASIGLQAVFPIHLSGAWQPTDKARFWAFSSFYVIFMMISGLAKEHNKPWLRWVPVALPVVFLFFQAIRALGLHFGWWVAHNSLP